MSATADVSTGLTVTFGTSGYTAEVVDVAWNGIARNSIETSHMGTAAAGAGTFGNRTFIPGHLSDPGEIRLSVHFNPDTLPPIDAAKETVTIQYDESGGDTTGASWAATGFVTGFEIAAPLDDKMTADVTVKLSGNVTRTAGS